MLYKSISKHEKPLAKSPGGFPKLKIIAIAHTKQHSNHSTSLSIIIVIRLWMAIFVEPLPRHFPQFIFLCPADYILFITILN